MRFDSVIIQSFDKRDFPYGLKFLRKTDVVIVDYSDF